ncbi:hypothetical protein NHX12_033740 [Muraenolepis orangiensis]|uniref:Uncharacterized protein n=1 Tax=Muraenolepis orangiensis TaxID=630683 RepID=A0A9Q0IJ26_9TELE|nr:hypothetical protein NHX12_033740 [Muraenolepis orangiensis]
MSETCKEETVATESVATATGESSSQGLPFRGRHQREAGRRLICLDMLFVLLGALPLINNREPSDNTPGHPANCITAA